MALTVAQILTNRVRLILRDTDDGGIQWKDVELFDWFNEACGEIARVRPESSSQTTEILGEAVPGTNTNEDKLVPGALQKIPKGGSRLLEIICNHDGTSEGRIVRRVERSTLDNEDVNWMTETRTAEVYRYAASLTDPRSFYVYPPTLATTDAGLTIVYSAPPPLVTAGSDIFPLPDMYAAPVANYVLYRAFGKVSESAEAMQKSQNYLQIYNSQIGDTISSMEQDNAVSRDPIRAGV